jgi:elongation factor P
MLSYNELKEGTIFVYEGQPYEVLKYDFLRKQQRKPVAQTELKNLITGKVLQRNFHMSESFEEADIEKITVKYLYHNKGEYWFCDVKNPSKRFSLVAETVGNEANFVKENSEVIAVNWSEKVINIIWPIKSELKIKETVPGERGNTAQGGTKTATLETGALIQVPLFINNGDVVRVNTSTGTYAERVEKAVGGL